MLEVVIVEMLPMALDYAIIPCKCKFPYETVLCTDDHHDRKPSNTCKENKLAHIYNPEKACGPVKHTPSCVLQAFLG